MYMNILVTGANRGLGLAFTLHYLQQGAHVWACYRSDPGGLQELDTSSLIPVQWDVKHAPGVETLSRLPETIDIVINNAGVYGPTKTAGQSLNTIKPDTMLEVFDINCVGAIRVVQAVRDRVVNARGIIANISSKMGSSADNSSGGCYAYRAAKAALVIVSRSMAVDLGSEGVRVVTLHPGWVRTDMTEHAGEIDASESVSGMCKVIEHVDDYEPGAFVAWDQEIVPY
jgi:NAD(P)-dependent dehydrogenase (short-subunit alcohol dehydrogenase family)